MFVMGWNRLWLAVAIVLVSILSVSSETTVSSLESCRDAGFDPYQLSCSTCDIVPKSMVDTCKSCCLSYKTLEKRTRRYQAAVLTHTVKMTQYFPEIDSIVKEDWKGLVEQKGEKRLILRDTSDKPQAPSILWFHKLPPNAKSMSIKELEKLAPETVHLVGWKRDDVREMIKAIIPDP